MSHIEIYIRDFKEMLAKDIPVKNFSFLNNIECNTIKHHTPIIIENCIFKSLRLSDSTFNYPIVFKHCEFGACDFSMNYFKKGFSISNCVFHEIVNFSFGWHNDADSPIQIKNTRFKDYVNFFDCQFGGSVELTNNYFKSGTNILCKYAIISFATQPLITDNRGCLDLEY